MTRELDGNPSATLPLTGAEILAGIQAGVDVNFDIDAVIAGALDRDNHTGIQPASSVDGLVAGLAARPHDSIVVHKTGAETIADVKTFTSSPVVPDASWTIAKTFGLQDALDARPADADVVKLTGAQTVAGIKTFSSSPVVPDASWTIAKTNGLQAALNAKAADADVVKLTGTQTVAGVKTFSSAPVIPDPTAAQHGATRAYVNRAAGVDVGTPGGVDDTALVNTARAAAGVGGTLIFSTGTYVVTGLTASLADQHWIIQPGAIVKTKNASNTPTIDVTANGVTIDGGGVIDGNRANQTDVSIGHSGLGTTACVRVISRSNVTIRGLIIRDGGSNGIMADACTNLTIKRNRISGSAPTGNSKQILVLDVVGSSSEIKIIGNRIDAVSRTNGCIAILVQDAARSIESLDISGNTCLVGEGGGAVETLGIELFTVPGGAIRDATVSRNRVYGPSGVTSADLIYGISCGGDSSGSTDGNTQVAITGNVIRNCPALSIEVVGSGVAVSGNTTYNCGPIAVLAITVAGGVRSVSVTGNTILDSIDTSYCFRIHGGTNGILGLVVSGNTVRNNAAGYIMLIEGEVSGASITGNTFTDVNGPGIGITGEFIDSIIANNVIDLTGVGGSTADGILLASTSIARLAINGNIIKGAARMGIYGSTVTDHVSIVGNRITGCDYGIFNQVATNLAIASNVCHGNTTADYNTTGSTFSTHVINGAGG